MVTLCSLPYTADKTTHYGGNARKMRKVAGFCQAYQTSSCDKFELVIFMCTSVFLSHGVHVEQVHTPKYRLSLQHDPQENPVMEGDTPHEKNEPFLRLSTTYLFVPRRKTFLILPAVLDLGSTSRPNRG